MYFSIRNSFKHLQTNVFGNINSPLYNFLTRPRNYQDFGTFASSIYYFTSFFTCCCIIKKGFPGGLESTESVGKAADRGSIPGL